jgi:insertion element IS1 protein InsB
MVCVSFHFLLLKVVGLLPVNNHPEDTPPNSLNTTFDYISCLFKKNYCWIWIAVDRYGKRFVNCVLGTRDTATGKQLWDALQDKEIEQVMTDFWKPYEHFVPNDIHIQSKAETYTVEGYNSLFRHFLARLRRKTKCYSKSKKMLLYSVMLLMLKWNDGLSAILN